MTVHFQLPQFDPDTFIGAYQLIQQKQRTYNIGKYGGNRYAVYRHMQYHDKEEVHDNIQNTGNQQRLQRHLGVPDTSENGCLKVIEENNGHSQ